MDRDRVFPGRWYYSLGAYLFITCIAIMSKTVFGTETPIFKTDGWWPFIFTGLWDPNLLIPYVIPEQSESKILWCD